MAALIRTGAARTVIVTTARLAAPVTAAHALSESAAGFSSQS
jgi:hypothetical protein